jgi:predicted esterase
LHTQRTFLTQKLRENNRSRETKFVFPNAPVIPVTVNKGALMPGWYDIIDFGDPTSRTEDEAGVLRSQKMIHALIQDEIDVGILPERIVLGGFSQGGSMGLMAGVTYSQRLGGIFGLSCLLLLKDSVKDMVPTESVSRKTPIFMGHGDADRIVQHAWGKTSAEKLRKWGWTVEFKTYEGTPHSTSPKEIDDLEAEILKWIPDISR